MNRLARRIVAKEAIGLVHCRSFPPALIGYRLKHATGVKYIFDFRDFYADGGLQKTYGLKHLAYKRMKHFEGPMVRHADKIVCLTERAKQVLIEWYLYDVDDAVQHFQVIPCCADFEHFDMGRVTDADVARARKRTGLAPGDFVLLYLGSLGPDYLLPQMMTMFRQVLKVRPGAYFLFVSNNGQELVEAECLIQGIQQEQIRFVSADRNEIPALIALADLSVIFIRADVSKAGCSPTKLAELFACNVPVIANSGVGDLDAILSLQRNGSVIVKDFSEKTLRKAVEKVLRFQQTNVLNIRDNSQAFSLEEGVMRYAAVYNEMLDNNAGHKRKGLK